VLIITILAERRPLTPTGGPYILLDMWGYAEGNATLVGIVVIVVALAAVTYVVMRVFRRGR
jgi:hypothetical protein